MSLDAWIDALKVVVFLIGVVTGVVGMIRAYRADPIGARITLRWVAVYALYCASALGAVMAWLDGPKPVHVALGVSLFLASWILYGAVWLARVVPKGEALAPWLARVPGPADTVLVVAALVGVVVAGLP